MTIRVLFAIVMLASAAALGQQAPTLQQDPSSGLYTLSYTDEAGTRRSVQFFGGAQVAPNASVAIDGQGPFKYAYTIKNDGSAKVPLFAIDVPCEESSTSSLRRPRLKVWNSVRARLPGPAVFYCGWTLGLRTEGDSGPPPGSDFGKALPLQSAWLPGIREGRADGATGEIHFPGFTDEMDQSIEQLYFPTQQPRLFPVVSPKYPPDAFRDPAQGISIVLDELTQACSLGWIGNPGVCNSLSVKLQHAQTSVGTPAGKNVLQAFLNELSAQNGKHVTANAYALLSTNVIYIVRGL